jgi:hypothetical protein
MLIYRLGFPGKQHNALEEAPEAAIEASPENFGY